MNRQALAAEVSAQIFPFAVLLFMSVKHCHHDKEHRMGLRGWMLQTRQARNASGVVEIRTMLRRSVTSPKTGSICTMCATRSDLGLHPHSFTHSQQLTHLQTHALTHRLTYQRTHLRAHSLPRALAHLLNCGCRTWICKALSRLYAACWTSLSMTTL